MPSNLANLQVDELMAPFLVLLIGKLTGWTQPTHVGGDPTYLSADQASALAVSGIGLLTTYLPQEAAQRVRGAIERLPRAEHGTAERRLLSVGSLGGVVLSTGHHGGDDNNPPGCCFRDQFTGQLRCVK